MITGSFFSTAWRSGVMEAMRTIWAGVAMPHMWRETRGVRDVTGARLLRLPAHNVSSRPGWRPSLGLQPVPGELPAQFAGLCCAMPARQHGRVQEAVEEVLDLREGEPAQAGEQVRLGAA